MVKDEDVYPIDTVVRIKKTGEFAMVKKHGWLRPERREHFLHYLAIIEGREDGLYALYHEEVDLEALPM